MRVLLLAAWASLWAAPNKKWVLFEIGNGPQRAGWTLMVPTRAMAARLEDKTNDSVVTLAQLREAFPGVLAPRDCKKTWDLRMFPKGGPYQQYASLETTAKGFFSPDQRFQKVSKFMKSGRPGMWVTNYYPAGPRAPGHTAHTYVALDAGPHMLILSAFSVSQEEADLNACANAYAQAFRRVADTIEPKKEAATPEGRAAPKKPAQGGAVPLLR